MSGKLTGTTAYGESDGLLKMAKISHQYVQDDYNQEAQSNEIVETKENL